MEDILSQLSDYQKEALRKGIAFDIDLTINSQKVAKTYVKMFYTVTGGFSAINTFSTTFTTGMSGEKKDARMNNIAHFLQTVPDYQEDNNSED